MANPMSRAAWRYTLATLALTTLLPAATPEAGEAAPDFELPSAAGTSRTLSASLENPDQ